MNKQPRSPTSFECRFDAGECAVFLVRSEMAESTFAVRLEYVDRQLAESPKFACGFSVFIERGELPSCVVARLFDKLKRVSPTRMDDEALRTFGDVATTWILFNFRPALEAPPVPHRVKEAVESVIARAAVSAIATHDLVLYTKLDDTLAAAEAVASLV
jgi:hypothetical protein